MSVLIGYAESPEGRAALRQGFEEAALRDLPVHVVRFVKVAAPGDAEGTKRQSTHLEAEERKLAELRERAARAGLQAQTHLILESRGEAQFVHDFRQLADRVGATLVVIGVRRRSPVGKLVLGSRAQDVLMHVDGDVLAVKATEQDQ